MRSMITRAFLVAVALAMVGCGGKSDDSASWEQDVCDCSCAPLHGYYETRAVGDGVVCGCQWDPEGGIRIIRPGETCYLAKPD